MLTPRAHRRLLALCLPSLFLGFSAAGCSAGAPLTPPLAPLALATSTPPSASLPALLPLPSSLSVAEDTPASADTTSPEDTTSAPPITEALPTAPTHRAFHEPTVPREQTHAVVLLYHLLGAMDTDMSISPAHFEEQMRWLLDNHVELVTTAEIASYLEGTLALPEHVAVVTLDDGHLTTYSRAFPILKKLGVRFTVALNTEAIEGHRPEAVTWNNVREMVATGLCEVASHSHIHGHMDRLTDDYNRREVTLSRAIIEERVGVRTETFVFPFGGHNARVRALVEEAGYRAAFAAWGGPLKKDSPRWQVPRSAVLRTTTIGAFARQFGATFPAQKPRPVEAVAKSKASAGESDHG